MERACLLVIVVVTSSYGVYRSWNKWKSWKQTNKKINFGVRRFPRVILVNYQVIMPRQMRAMFSLL